MRLGANILQNTVSGEYVEFTHRPENGDSRTTVRISLSQVGSGPGPHLHPTQVESFAWSAAGSKWCSASRLD